ncbi:MAG: nitronate monooxygenase [Pseudonocardiaceae bacterium]
MLGIDVPIICAPFGAWDQVELAAAVCAAGGLGSLGTAVVPLPELRAQWARLRDHTDRPFAINHTVRPLDEEAFAATVDFGPRSDQLPPRGLPRPHHQGTRRRHPLGAAGDDPPSGRGGPRRGRRCARRPGRRGAPFAFRPA